MKIQNKQILFRVYLRTSKTESWRESVKILKKKMKEIGYKPYSVNCSYWNGPKENYSSGDCGAPFEFVKKKISPFYLED